MPFKEDFAKCYGSALAQLFERWHWNTDDGCFQDTRNRDTWEHGGVKAIYQPHKTMQVNDFESDQMFATIFFKRADGKAISAAQWKQAQEQAKLVEKLVLEEYNEVLSKTDGKWINKVDGTWTSLARIKKPLELRPDGMSISFCFEIRISDDYEDGILWSPRKLKTWIGHEYLSHCEVQEDGTLKEEFMDKCKYPATRATFA